MNGDNIWADFDDANNIEDTRGFNFGGLLNNLVKTGGDVAGRFLAPKPAPQPQQVTQPRPQPTWLVPAIIGGVLLVVLVFAGVLFSGRK